MDLKQLFSKRETLTEWFEFCEGFFLNLEYTDAFAIGKMLEASKVQAWKRHQKIEEYDDDKFGALLASKVKGWRGFTVGVLAGLTNIDISDIDPATEIEFNRDNLVDAMKQIPGMSNFIRATMMELANFRRIQQDEEIKN